MNPSGEPAEIGDPLMGILLKSSKGWQETMGARRTPAAAAREGQMLFQSAKTFLNETPHVPWKGSPITSLGVFEKSLLAITLCETVPAAS